MIYGFADLSREFPPQVLEVALCCHSWLGVRNAADVVALHLHDAVEQGVIASLVLVITVERRGYGLGKQLAAYQVDCPL